MKRFIFLSISCILIIVSIAYNYSFNLDTNLSKFLLAFIATILSGGVCILILAIWDIIERKQK